MFFRVFKSRDPSFFVRLFRVYVQPVLTYCSPVFACNSAFVTNSSDKVVKYFTRRLWLRVNGSARRPSYLERLKYFSIESNETFIMRKDLLMLFKVIRGLVDIPQIQVKFSARVPHRIILNRVKTNFLRNHFTLRASKLWNLVIRDGSFRSMSLPLFKRHIASLDLTPFISGRAFKA